MILQQINQEFEAVLELTDQDAIDLQLTNLMTRMEKAGVPLMNDPEWNRKNPDWIRLYRKLGNARSIYD